MRGETVKVVRYTPTGETDTGEQQHATQQITQQGDEPPPQGVAAAAFIHPLPMGEEIIGGQPADQPGHRHQTTKKHRQGE